MSEFVPKLINKVVELKEENTHLQRCLQSKTATAIHWKNQFNIANRKIEELEQVIKRLKEEKTNA